jgi:hypothetical protein
MHTTTLEPAGRRLSGVSVCNTTTPAPENRQSGAGVHPSHARGGRREGRYGLQATVQKITTVDRVQGCGWRRIHKDTAPAVVVAAGVAHVAGTQRCGSVWLCPVCGPKIRQGRAEELDTVLVRWLKAHGTGTVQLWTLTAPHHSGEPLKDLRQTIRAAWKHIASGRTWREMRARYGIEHTVSALDVTHGPNGWHPHLHIIVLTKNECDDDAVRALLAHVRSRWHTALVQRGRPAPHPIHGAQIERARSRKDVGRYLCQVIGETDDDDKAWSVAQETARTDLKTSRVHGHRTPWQIVQDIRTRRAKHGDWDAVDEAADTRDLALWREYEIAMKGARAISFSQGLRAAVGLDVEATDEELAEAEVGGTVVCVIDSRREWTAVRLTHNGLPRLLRVAVRFGEKGTRRLLKRMLYRKRHHPLLRNEPADS